MCCVWKYDETEVLWDVQLLLLSRIVCLYIFDTRTEIYKQNSVRSLRCPLSILCM